MDALFSGKTELNWLIQLQVEESLDKLKIVLKTMKEFKAAFQSSKTNIGTYFKADQTPKTWEFQVNN